MISLLIIAGVGLSADAISWYNQKKLREVQEKIDRLNERLADIKQEDLEKRKEIIGDYVTELIMFAEEELEFREELYGELDGALETLNESQKIGGRHSSRFIKNRSELIKIIGILNAERYHIKNSIQSLRLYLEEPEGGIPTIEQMINLPYDYPADFKLLQVEEDLPNEVYGYHLSYQDSEWRDENQGWALIYDVDHENLKAKASFSAAALFEAYEQESYPIEAVVRDYTQHGIELEYCGVNLFLNRNNPEYRSKPDAGIGSVLEVYPTNWDLSKFDNLLNDKTYKKGTENRVKNALPVSLIPRLENSKKRWNSLPLYVKEAQIKDLVDAFNYLEEKNANEEPFEIFYSEDSHLVFYIEGLSIKCAIESSKTKRDTRTKLVFKEVTFGAKEPSLSVNLSAELAVVREGVDEDLNNSPTLVDDFLAALEKELEEKREYLNIRSSSLSLKKFNSIYQAQIEYKRTNSVCSFFPVKFNKSKKTVVGLIAEDTPDWLVEELEGEYPNKIDAVSDNYIFRIERAVLLDSTINSYKLYLKVPEAVDSKVITSSPINRIVYNVEGIPAQVLSNTLKKTAAGKFKSQHIYNTLMNIDGDIIENENRGREKVDDLLANKENELVVVWGPPGSGKTTTIVDWLLKLFEPGKESNWPSVLIAGPTHVSIDNLLERVLERNGALSETMVRYGNEEKINDNLNPIWYYHLIDDLIKKKELNEDERKLHEEWQNLLDTRDGKRDAISWTIAKRKIHAATCVGMARRSFNLTNRDFDIVIIDEAGKAFPAEILLPASLASKRLILIGDHKQLPPTVMQEDISQEVGYRLPLDEVEAIMKNNMFKRLFEQLPADHKAMLDLQYRMHGDIGDVISSMFYDGKLESHKRGTNGRLFKDRINFIDFSKLRNYQQVKFKQSLENPEEREALEQFLLQLHKKNSFDKEKSILIICPYKGQRIKVQALFNRLDLNLNIKVSTVDAVQGGEASIVILLMTRSRNSTDFLLDENRINVALSRAEDYVFIFGDQRCLTEKSHSPFKRLLDPDIHKGNLRLVSVNSTNENEEVFESLFKE